MAASVSSTAPIRNNDCGLTHEEVAAIMTNRGFPMCRGRVWQIERSALKKIAADPVIRQMADDLGFGDFNSK